MLAAVLKLTILEVVTSVSGEAINAESVPSEASRGSSAHRSELKAKAKADMSSFLDGGGHYLSDISCLAGEKLELGDLSLDLKGLVSELLGVDELLLVQDVPCGGHGQAEAETKEDQGLHCVSVSSAELLTTEPYPLYIPRPTGSNWLGNGSTCDPIPVLFIRLLRKHLLQNEL